MIRAVAAKSECGANMPSIQLVCDRVAGIHSVDAALGRIPVVGKEVLFQLNKFFPVRGPKKMFEI